VKIRNVFDLMHCLKDLFADSDGLINFLNQRKKN